MNTGYVITDRKGNEYRLISTSFACAIQTVKVNHNITEDDITNVQKGKTLSSIGL